RTGGCGASGILSCGESGVSKQPRGVIEKRFRNAHSSAVALLSDQRDKAAGDLLRQYGLAFLLRHELQKLRFGGTDGNDQAPAFLQLLKKSLRQIRRGCGNDDAVKWRVRRKPLAAVPYFDGDVRVSEFGERGLCFCGPNSAAFDGIYVTAELCQQRRLVTRAGADLEHDVFFADLEHFEHQSDDVGLGYGLAFPDGKRVIVVGLGAVGVGDKLVAWNTGHRCQDSLIPDATLQELLVDHLTTALREVQIGDGEEGFQGSVSSFRFRVSSVLPLDLSCDSQDLSSHTMVSDRVYPQALPRVLSAIAVYGSYVERNVTLGYGAGVRPFLLALSVFGFIAVGWCS